MNPPFLLESLVYSDFKAVAKPFTTKTSNPTLSSSQHLIRFVSLLLLKLYLEVTKTMAMKAENHGN